MDETQRAESIRNDVKQLAKELGYTEKDTWNRLAKMMPEITKYKPTNI